MGKMEILQFRSSLHSKLNSHNLMEIKIMMKKIENSKNQNRKKTDLDSFNY